MFLILEEIVNTSSENTLLIVGQQVDWGALPGWIESSGANAFRYLMTGLSLHIVRPLPDLTAETTGDPPSLAAARALAQRLWQDNSFSGVVPETDFTFPGGYTGDQPTSRIGFCHFPSCEDARDADWITSPGPVLVLAVRPDGGFTYTLVQLLVYREVVGPDATEEPQRPWLAIDSEHLLTGVNHIPRLAERASGPEKWALRLTTWSLGASTREPDLRTIFMSAGFDPFLEGYHAMGWPDPVTQTLLLDDHSPLRDRIDLPDDGAVDCPSSPMLRIALIAGHSMLPERRGRVDYGGAELSFEAEEARKKAQAWGALAALAFAIVKMVVDTAVPPEFRAGPDRFIDETFKFTSKHLPMPGG